MPHHRRSELVAEFRTYYRLPGDALLARGQITLYPSEAERDAALAQLAATNHQAGRREALVVDTLDQVHALNVEVRARLVDAGVVDDHRTATTDAGQGIGAGDLIATRRNNTDLDVANRDTWTVTRAHRDGSLIVTAAGSNTAEGERTLTPGYVREHVELAYATTTHGVQADTLTASHVGVGETTSAAAW
jgi:exodeoxyribonuclease V alpha subunit